MTKVLHQDNGHHYRAWCGQVLNHDKDRRNYTGAEDQVTCKNCIAWRKPKPTAHSNSAAAPLPPSMPQTTSPELVRVTMPWGVCDLTLAQLLKIMQAQGKAATPESAREPKEPPALPAPVSPVAGEPVTDAAQDQNERLVLQAIRDLGPATTQASIAYRCKLNPNDTGRAIRRLRIRGVIRAAYGHYAIVGENPQPRAEPKRPAVTTGPRVLFVAHMVAAGREAKWTSEQAADKYRELYAAMAADGVDPHGKTDENGKRLSCVEWLERNGHLETALEKAELMFPVRRSRG